jgi:hypothetical protein
MGCATFWSIFYKLIWDRCYDFLDIYGEKIGKKSAKNRQKIAVFDSKTLALNYSKN